MSLLKTENVIVNRTTKTFSSKGRKQESSPIVFSNVEINIQPLMGNEILQLPEGDRERENLWCYTDFALQVNDEVVRNGKKFEVLEVQDWTTFGMLSHYRVRIISKDRQ